MPLKMEINGWAEIQVSKAFRNQPREVFSENMNKVISAAFLFFQIFLLEQVGRERQNGNFCSYNEVSLPLQTKGKKVLIAFCMAIKKSLGESQPKIERRSGSAGRKERF